MKMILMIALAAGSMLAQTASTPAPPNTSNSNAGKSKKTAKATPPLTIPETAVDQGDGSFRYVDSKGVAWIYRKTPFGVSRATEATVLGHTVGETPFGQSKSQPAASPATKEPKPGSPDDPNAKVTAVAKGDLIQFSRPTPFGVTKWEKNKNDLTPDEQKIWSRLQPKGNQ